MPDKNAPLTSEEITEAADIFFPLFKVITVISMLIYVA